MIDIYWAQVQACLCVFHAFETEAARKKTQAARRSFAKAANQYKVSESIEEHTEPFFMACRLAERKLELEPRLQRYKELLKSQALPTQKQKPSNAGELLRGSPKLPRDEIKVGSPPAAKGKVAAKKGKAASTKSSISTRAKASAKPADRKTASRGSGSKRGATGRSS